MSIAGDRPGSVAKPGTHGPAAHPYRNCGQTARSSAVTVSQPNVNMYRPGSVTCPAFCQVILLTTNRSFLLRSAIDIRGRSRESRLGAGPERSSTLSHVEGGQLQLH